MSDVEGDPLVRRLPPTLLIRHAVEQWPNRPDPEAFVLEQLQPRAMIWVRTRWGIKQRQIRMVRKASWWRGNRNRRFVIAHDRKGWCHRYWVSDIIRVQPRRWELSA